MQKLGLYMMPMLASFPSASEESGLFSLDPQHDAFRAGLTYFEAHLEDESISAKGFEFGKDFNRYAGVNLSHGVTREGHLKIKSYSVSSDLGYTFPINAWLDIKPYALIGAHHFNQTIFIYEYNQTSFMYGAGLRASGEHWYVDFNFKRADVDNIADGGIDSVGVIGVTMGMNFRGLSWD